MENTVITAVEPTDHAQKIGDLTRFFRWDEESRQYQMNSQIDPQIGTESWVNSPSPVRDRIVSPNHNPSVGEIIHAWNNSANREANLQQRFDEFQRQAYRAIEIIGERLISESDRRGWCDEFDRIIEEVNGELPGPFALPEREKEYEVSWTETVMVSIDRSVTVRARNRDDALEQAPDEIDSISTSEVVDAARYGSWEVDEYADHDYEVREV